MRTLKPLLLLVVLGPVLACVSPAVARTLHPRFSRYSTSTAAGRVIASGDYAFLANRSGSGSVGTLIDDRTGRRTTLNRSGCGTPVVGGGWLAFDCYSAGIQLYALSTGAWRSGPALPPCNGCYSDSVSPVAVGAYWVGFSSFTCADDSSHNCSGSSGFENIYTGQVLGDPARGSTAADPNQPALARRLCRPLRVPTYTAFTGDTGDVQQPDGIQFYGRRFVLATVPSPLGSVSASYEDYSLLERCGSHAPRRINGDPIVGTSRLLVWPLNPSGNGPNLRGPLQGLLLGSGRRFAIALPSSVLPDLALGLAVDSRYLYVGRWRTPVSRLLKLATVPKRRCARRCTAHHR